jgi:hypothetical protein
MFGSPPAARAERPAPSSATAAPAARPRPRWENRSGFVGFVLRPQVCVSKCEGTLTTFGAEVGHRPVAFAFRYGYGGGGNNLMLDVRLFWDFAVHRMLKLTPLLEATTAFGLGSESGTSLKILQVLLRPGFRVIFSPIPRLGVYLEPFGLDLAVRTWSWTNRPDDARSDVSSKVVIRYTMGAGMQYWF